MTHLQIVLLPSGTLGKLTFVTISSFIIRLLDFMLVIWAGRYYTHACHFSMYLTKKNKVDSTWIQVVISIISSTCRRNIPLALFFSSSGSPWATQLLPGLKNTFKNQNNTHKKTTQTHNSKRIYTHGLGTFM